MTETREAERRTRFQSVPIKDLYPTVVDVWKRIESGELEALDDIPGFGGEEENDR